MSSMTPFMFKCPGFTKEDGAHTIDVRAVHTSTDGILLTESSEYRGAYRLTHEASGMAIVRGASMDAFGLLKLAAALSAAGDWTRSAPSLANDQGLSRAIKPITDAAGIDWLLFEPSPEHAAESRSALDRMRN